MWSLPSRSLAVIPFVGVLILAQTTRTSGRSQEPNPQAPPNVNVLTNGTYTDGMAGWLQYATPDPSYVVTQLTNGVLEFYRVPGPAFERPNQAVVFQWTGLSLPAGAPVVASFDMGNSSSVRKRMSVLVHDSDFSDLHVCTFWLAPNAPLRTYTMRTHTTRIWSNTTIAFYAASGGTNGGFYQLDNVSLMYDPAGASDRTICGDPTAPAVPGGPAGPELIANGGFSAGLAPWEVFHRITYQLTAGVFEFIWPPSSSAGDGEPTIPSPEPAPVVMQTTGQLVAPGEILTATVDLGNSSTVRKRVTVLVHQWDFVDLAACTFWLEPGAPLATYTVRTFATIAWGNATLSVYASTQGPETWIRVDNGSLRRTPGSATVGTECYEPTPELAPAATPAVGAPGLRNGASGLPRGIGAPGLQTRGHTGLVDPRFRYWLAPSETPVEIQVSTDGETWQTVSIVEPSDDWRVVTIDVSRAGRAVFVRVRR